ncbi:dihydroxyacetone kinase subunit DhaL [Mycoplasma leonicaptivi]|uniref:dihydroxyacetone kinase subunit DhaL n=1 Tax=Mycoplasma leonicaptivi TaxID=36742 RepID=UPI0006853C4E|nr:dihydroxyacetone kinase subunit DhaL [Mycoplasma leonicaptivi]
MKIEYQNLVNAILQTNKDIKDNEERLSELDQSIGDGDHGFNMVRGYNEVSLINPENLTLSVYLSKVGTALMSKVGGASGPLYGMCFMNTANKLKNTNIFDLAELKILVETFVLTLKMLGKCEEKQKTMFDVWSPLNAYLSKISEVNDQVKKQLIDFIFECVENTKDMIATRGRASYLKERSSGSIDPGSFSSFLLLRNLISVL